MSTATASPVIEPQEASHSQLVVLARLLRPGQSAAITNVSWGDYEQMLTWRDDHFPRTMFLTYDHQRLEIMVVTNRHDRLKKMLALLVEAWLAETGGEYLPSGQLTHKREDLERGFEPDECYYIQNWKKLAGLREIDFRVDPPPDLMIEIEVSRSLNSRLHVVSDFKLPEVWRYDGKRLTVLRLRANGTYTKATTSRAIPNFPFADAPQFLRMAESLDKGFASIDREFRAWIKTSHSST